MSQHNEAHKNKHSKVFFHQYLHNIAEPGDDRNNDIPPELEAELLENSFTMKRRFRHLASKMRDRYK